jgi:nicotinate-nucleotide adenylyltransferase
MAPRARIGVFGGSFDPVHCGHVLLARAAREELGLSRVLLLPCAASADGKELAPAALRLRWLKRALKGEPGLEACDLEIRRGGVSRTVDTLEALQAGLDPGEGLVLLLGADQAARIATWKRPRRLAELAELAVFGRPGRSAFRAEGFEFLRVPAPLFGFSSTGVRERLAAGLSVRLWVPPEVEADPTLRRHYGPKTGRRRSVSKN